MLTCVAEYVHLTQWSWVCCDVGAEELLTDSEASFQAKTNNLRNQTGVLQPVSV